MKNKKEICTIAIQWVDNAYRGCYYFGVGVILYQMKKLVLLILISILLISCKKEKDIDSFLEENFKIEVKIDDCLYFSDSTKWHNAQVISKISVNSYDLGIKYIIDSLNSVRISIGLAYTFKDYYDNPNCPDSYELNDSLFYSIFHTGNYKYRSSYSTHLLPQYDPFIYIQIEKDGICYSSIRLDGTNSTTNNNNFFSLNNTSVIKKINDWTDCDHLRREIKTKGNFECYVYTHFELDSIKVDCNNFIGMFHD